MIPPDGFSLTKGRKPRTGETRLTVAFRKDGGIYIDDRNTYRAADLDWRDTGSDWQPVAVRKAEK